MLEILIVQPIDVKTTFWQMSYIELIQVEEKLVQTLVENIAKNNRNCFPIVVLLTTLICSRLTTANLFFSIPTKILGNLGPLVYRWKGLENTFPTVYYMPPTFLNCIRKRKKKILQSFSDYRS
jgi:hypothetical protein